MPSPGRIAAFEILRKVEAGGYASDLLLERTTKLESRDAGLASEIVFGVLRFRAQLDYLIELYSGRRQKLDAEVRIALRMALYQLRYLERIPPHAAVAESVDLVRLAHKRSAMGFVNAVLRKVNRDPVEWPTREIELSCPEWLLARWDLHYGPDASAAIARAALVEPEKYVVITPTGPRMQDIGSQSIIPLLAIEPGHTFLDVCAAPGNKTLQAMATNPALAIACDLHHRRLAPMRDFGAHLVVLDATQPLPFSRRFDRILVDAPCSGTGTLGRNPEIKWRLRPEDLADLHRKQAAILSNALAALAPGGVLVYSTCSLEREENEDVATAAIQVTQRLPGRDPGDGFFAAILRT